MAVLFHVENYIGPPDLEAKTVSVWNSKKDLVGAGRGGEGTVPNLVVQRIQSRPPYLHC